MTMTQRYKTKLIEVALPLEAINTASAREKLLRHGHPSTLHTWWARRPLAACRAILFAQLVDDPTNFPEVFTSEEAIEAERKRLFKIIEELVVWENSTNKEVLDRATAEIRKSCDGVIPAIYDPFSGGASIPLEAQRLGLPAYGSDLNPVAVMIGKASIEVPSKFRDNEPVHQGGKDRNHYRNAEGLAEDVRFYGRRIRDEAYLRVGALYPEVSLPQDMGGGKSRVMAWIWARTVASPEPSLQGKHVPLTNSFILCSKKGREAIVVPKVDRHSGTYTFEVRGTGVSASDLEDSSLGTKAGKAQDFICLVSKTPITREYIRQQGKAGHLGNRLMAVICEGKRGRLYCAPTPEMEAVANTAHNYADLKTARETFLSGSTPTRAMITGGVCSAYGLSTWGHIFSDRQLAGLLTFSDLVQAVQQEIERDGVAAGLSDDQIPLRSGGTGARAYAEAVSIYLAFTVDKCADYWSSLCSWHSSKEQMRNTFGRQALPMVWDYAEANPFSDSSGNWGAMLDWVWKTLENFYPGAEGVETQSDAQAVEYPENTVISTDPPYYDNIAYADLSDFFFCWMKQSLKNVYPDLFSLLSTPKAEELVATQFRHGSKEAAEAFFLSGMRDVISNMAASTSDAYPATIYYAFKQSEIAQEGISSTGWATFLQAVVDAGYAVVGTWPLRTEMASRMIASGTNALANSVVLVCRKRERAAEVVSRAEFVRALKRELPPAIAELQAANIAPADMPQSSIGPGMGVYSRYGAVLESDDSPMPVKSALQLINRELDEYLGGIQGEFDADTRFAIGWFEQNGTKAGEYGIANSIAQARGISVESVKHAGIVESAAGKVRILTRDELASDWSPEDDNHLTVWECCQHLIRTLENDGEHSAASLLKAIGTEKADAVKDLAYCLYGICEKRSDAKEATSYNGLIAVWTELTRQAAAIHDTGGDRQTRLDL